MAETTRPNRSGAWDRASKPTAAWADLQRQAHTDEERACLAAATRQADRVWIALHSGRLDVGTETPTVPVRDADWHRLAISAYEVLRESGAYGHLAQIRTWACAAAEPIIAAWLNSPANPDQTDASHTSITVAQSLGVGDPVNLINGDTQVAHLSTLLNAAQDAAVFGVPRHRVELVTAPGQHDTGSVVRVVVDAPMGLALASEPLQLGVLVDTDATDGDAATAALRRVADIATDLFQIHARAVWTAPPPIPTTDRTATPVGRAFPELRLDQRAAPAATPTPSPGPAPAAHRRGNTSETDRPGRSR